MKLRKMLCLTLTLMLLAPAAGNAELDLTTPAPTPEPTRRAAFGNVAHRASLRRGHSRRAAKRAGDL